MQAMTDMTYCTNDSCTIAEKCRRNFDNYIVGDRECDKLYSFCHFEQDGAGDCCMYIEPGEEKKMQEELNDGLITDTAMQYHMLNNLINKWVRVSTKALADGDYELQNHAAVIIQGISKATFAMSEIVEQAEGRSNEKE